MSNDTYVVSYECAGKIYVVAKSGVPALLSSRTVAVGAVRKVVEQAAAGDPLAAVVAVMVDFRIHLASSIPGRTAPADPVIPGLSGVIVRGRHAKAWHSRGRRPFSGPKVPRRSFAPRRSSRYNTEDRPVYGT